jgi:RHS repeat-associated protein
VWGERYIDDLALSDEGSTRYYYCQDANFNVVATLNPTGSVVERYAYTPYGVVTYLDDEFDNPSTASTIGNEYLYTGRRRDAETGLQLNRNRYYHAQLGRWLTRDPIGYLGGSSLYGYVGEMPTRYTDYRGLKPTKVQEPWGWLQPVRNHGGGNNVTSNYCRASVRNPQNQWLKCACEVSQDISGAIAGLTAYNDPILGIFVWASYDPVAEAKKRWFNCTRTCLQDRWREAILVKYNPTPGPFQDPPTLTAGSSWKDWCEKCKLNEGSQECCEMQVEAEQTELQKCFQRCGKWSWGHTFPMDWIDEMSPNKDFNDLATRIDIGNKRCCSKK